MAKTVKEIVEEFKGEQSVLITGNVGDFRANLLTLMQSLQSAVKNNNLTSDQAKKINHDLLEDYAKNVTGEPNYKIGFLDGWFEE